MHLIGFPAPPISSPSAVQIFLARELTLLDLGLALLYPWTEGWVVPGEQATQSLLGGCPPRWGAAGVCFGELSTLWGKRGMLSMRYSLPYPSSQAPTMRAWGVGSRFELDTESGWLSQQGN